MEKVSERMQRLISSLLFLLGSIINHFLIVIINTNLSLNKKSAYIHQNIYSKIFKIKIYK